MGRGSTGGERGGERRREEELGMGGVHKLKCLGGCRNEEGGSRVHRDGEGEFYLCEWRDGRSDSGTFR